MVYRPVSRSEIVDVVQHLRQLFRTAPSTTLMQQLAAERRELFSRNLVSNLMRTGQHPTLNTVLEIADAFSLTVDGAHRIFGYHLDELRILDEELNSGRTHIIEAHSFQRDLLIDLPEQLANNDVFERDSSLKEIVIRWQQNVPIRALSEVIGWRSPGVFYVRVGFEDSLGSGLPPGSLALVQPASQAEGSRPDPRSIYLLQFGNGYRCSRCVISGSKLILISSGTLHSGPREFLYPSAVRVVGRIRYFALRLPARDPLLPNRVPPFTPGPAPLVLPWEHSSLAALFSAKHSRFRRSLAERGHVRERLETAFQADLSERTARRYRRPTASLPHVSTLMQLSVTHFTPYSNSVDMKLSRSEDGKFSLEPLLKSRSLPEAALSESAGHLPMPLDRWEYLRTTFVEWPTLLSLSFPRLEPLKEMVVRLARGVALPNLHPPIGPGSLLLLEPLGFQPDLHRENKQTGWHRPIYVHRSRGRIICGYLEAAGNGLALVGGDAKVHVSLAAGSWLERVAGVVVPLQETA